ncbi:hypothetical protein H5395_14400 [Paracoccus sp. MC1854]|nr:hypothetical protein [Paracoccus sp. MC1854]MBB1492700.1 hypothetical protein [Paracoccus sp. MC1854]
MITGDGNAATLVFGDSGVRLPFRRLQLLGTIVRIAEENPGGLGKA